MSPEEKETYNNVMKIMKNSEDNIEPVDNTITNDSTEEDGKDDEKGAEITMVQMSEKALEVKKIPSKRSGFQREAEIRTSRRNGSQKCLEKVVDGYGEYLVFDNLPYHLMGQMIIEFRCYEFDQKYDNQCSNICAGNTLLPEGQKSTY